MPSMAEQGRWLAAETAQHYKTFTEQTTMYQELSRKMVGLADIEPGMTVLDLGCGTGVTTQAVLPLVGEMGRILAVDISEPMLAVARENVTAPQVTFIQADAADLAEVKPQSVDRIVCNSVFWQLRDKLTVMAELRQVLKLGGLFVFNAPEPYFIFQEIPYSRRASVLLKQFAAERYGVGSQDKRTMRVFLERNGFTLQSMIEFQRMRSAEESYLFYHLPVATAWMDPPLDYETRMALLEEARQQADPDQAIKQRWMYFVAKYSG